MKTVASVEIDRPVEEVFRLTTERVADWSLIVVEDEVIDETSEGVGTTFRTVTEERGKRMEFQGLVTKFEPPNLHAITLTGDSFDIDTEFVLEDLGDGRTRVSQGASVTGKGFFKLIAFVLGGLMKKSQCEASDNELRSLKEFCEKEIASPNSEV